MQANLQAPRKTVFHALAARGRVAATAGLAVAAMMSAGCASAAVADVAPAGVPQRVSADVIYVHTFAADASQVKLDSGLLQKIRDAGDGGSADAQARTAAQARERVADEIVARLNAQGLHAVHSDAAVPAGVNALVVDGSFRRIDEGTGRRRLLLGFGAGKSEVAADVQVSWQPAAGAAEPLQRFAANADSGHIPGVAETAGVGALAGHVAVSAAAGAGVHGVTEAKHDTIYADATRMGDSIAKQIVAASAAEGWLSAAAAR